MKLSIIIPTYNVVNYIDECLQSLLPQLTDECELIIVDDCSTDGTKEKIFGYLTQEMASKYFQYKDGEKNFKFYMHEANKGVSAARNVGLKVATGEYIDFIDSDDNIVEGYIKKMLEMCDLGLDFFYKSWKRFGSENGEVIIKDKAPDWNWSVWARCIKRDKIGNIRFDESLKATEDADFLKKVLYSGQKYTHGAISTPIYLYRCGDPTRLSNTVLREMAKAKAEREKNEKK